MKILQGITSFFIILVFATMFAGMCVYSLKVLDQRTSHKEVNRQEMIAGLKNCEEVFGRECALSYSIAPIKITNNTSKKGVEKRSL